MPRTTTRKSRAKAARPTLQRFIAAARDNVTTRAGEAAQVIAERLAEARTRTTDTLGTVEKVFEQRVSRAMKVLGVPSAREVQALSREVSRLQDAVEQLRRRRARA